MKANKLVLGARLTAAAGCLRGGCVADIGTDHAYLPVYLVQNGYTGAIVASDVAEGPLNKARAALERYSCSDRVTLVHADGLNGIEAYAPEDIVIAGMGGELIASIIAASDYVKGGGVRLILQPMSRSSCLRRWLCENGFAVTDELLVRDSRIFELIIAIYGGAEEYSDVECILGRINIRKRSEPFEEFARRKYNALYKQAEGMKFAGLDADKYFRLCDEIKELIE